MTVQSLIIQKLLATNSHLSRRLTEHHFKPFTYGIRNGLTIIDSEKTLISLRTALAFIASLTRTTPNPRFTFVNTNPLFDEIVETMTRKLGLYSPSNNLIWRQSGWLTNRNSPKKFRSRNKKVCFTPSQAPDCVVVIDSERKASVVLEAERLQIPVVALVDSTTPRELFRKIAYPVPANDSVQFVYLFCNMVTKTLLAEMKKKGVGRFREGVEEEVEEGGVVESLREKKANITILNRELDVIAYESLPPLPDDSAVISKLLDKLVVLKFNGALGTNLGFSGPKSSIEIRDGLTSLDLIVNQIQSLRSKYGCDIPLLLLNTSETHDETLKLVEKYSRSDINIVNFNLEKLPLDGSDELRSSDHSAMFLSLMESETVDILLSQGKKYILAVDSDNAAAVIDPKTLCYLALRDIDYCMEVAETSSDDLTGRREGKIRLAEITNSRANLMTEKFKLADTRTLWANLNAIETLADTDSLKMKNLPASKVDENDDLIRETVVSSAIRLFDSTIGLNVPGSRVLPINTVSDLLLLQSDLYTSAEGILVRNQARKNPVNPVIDLGPKFRKVSDLQSRFKSIPSMIELDSLKVNGDVWFGAGITLKGNVSVLATPGTRLEIPDGVVLQDKEIKDIADI